MITSFLLYKENEHKDHIRPGAGVGLCKTLIAHCKMAEGVTSDIGRASSPRTPTYVHIPIRENPNELVESIEAMV